MTLNLENRMKRGKGGFTLIELLVVIAIIGVLAAVVLVSLNTARQRGRDAKRLADLDAVRLALEVYSDQNGSVYPAVSAVGNDPTLATFEEIADALVADQLLSARPIDPVTGRNYVGQLNAITNATSYLLGADLETAQAACGSDYDALSFGAVPGSVCDDEIPLDQCSGDEPVGDLVDYCICQGTACS